MNIDDILELNEWNYSSAVNINFFALTRWLEARMNYNNTLDLLVIMFNYIFNFIKQNDMNYYDILECIV